MMAFCGLASCIRMTNVQIRKCETRSGSRSKEGQQKDLKDWSNVLDKTSTIRNVSYEAYGSTFTCSPSATLTGSAATMVHPVGSLFVGIASISVGRLRRLRKTCD